MKKIVSISIALILILISTIVKATISFDAILTTDKTIVKPGDEIEIIFKLDNFTENEKGINVILGTLNYDRTIFETISQEDIIVIQNWTDPTYNSGTGQFVTDSYNFINSTHDVFKIKFKVKDNADFTETEIKILNINASDSETDIMCNDAIVKISMDRNTINNDYNIKNIIYIVIGAIVAILLLVIVIVLVKKYKK